MQRQIESFTVEICMDTERVFPATEKRNSIRKAYTYVSRMHARKVEKGRDSQLRFAKGIIMHISYAYNTFTRTDGEKNKSSDQICTPKKSMSQRAKGDFATSRC